MTENFLVQMKNNNLCRTNQFLIIVSPQAFDTDSGACSAHKIDCSFAFQTAASKACRACHLRLSCVANYNLKEPERLFEKSTRS